MNHQVNDNEIVRQLFEACREQPQSLQRIKFLVRGYTDTGANGNERESALETRRRPFSQARDENGLTPLSVACLYGAPLPVIHFLAMEQLLQKYQKLDIDNCNIDDSDDGDTNENIDNCLQYACFAGAPNDVITYLFEFDPKGVTLPDCTGQLPLHMACCSPNSNGVVSLASILSLIRQYPKAVTIADHKGRLPLHHACSNPSITLPVVQCLVKEYPAAVQMKDRDGMLPLHRACWYRAPLEVVDFIVDQYPHALQCPEQDGELPLHLACLSTTTTTSTTAATTEAYLDEEEETSLTTLISLLLQRYPQAMCERNLSGYIPLELVSEKLPDAYALRVLRLLAPSGWPIMHFACDQGCSMRIMYWLLRLFPKAETTSSSTPASPSDTQTASPSVNSDESGDNPKLHPLLFYACQGRRANLYLIQLLMEYNPLDVSAKSQLTGDTVLHHACRHGAPAHVVEHLIHCDPAAVSTKNHKGYIPLHLAMMMHQDDDDDDEDTQQQLKKQEKDQQQYGAKSSLSRQSTSSPPSLDVLFFLVRNYPDHIMSSTAVV